MRLTKKVFHDLAIWMVCFGLCIGVVFPFFVMLLGVPSEIALTLTFFLACLGAGALAGGINFALARLVVGARMKVLAHSMTHVEENLLEMTTTGDLSICSPEECLISVDSEDEIGESAEAFNRLVAALSASMETQVAVRTLGEILASQLELKTLATQALEQFLLHTEAVSGALLIDTGGEVNVLATQGIRDAEKLASSDYVRIARESGETQWIDFPEELRIDGVIAEIQPRQVLILPVVYKGIVLAVVVLAASNPIGEESSRRLELFRKSLGLALNNAIAHDKIQQMAALDGLTKVFNRRFGLARLHEEFERAVRAGTTLGLMMFDIDHFKSVNDTYGHRVGDRVLEAIAGMARTVLREGDVLLRYGGEEFLAVLPAAAIDDLERIGERLRRTVEEGAISHESQTIRVTVSIGATSYPSQHVEREAQLIQLADDALYKAKDSGRNRLILAK